MRQLSPNDLDAAVAVQSIAFQNDPLWLYLFPSLEQRAQVQSKFFRFFFKAALKNGQVYGLGEPLAGVAIWSKPEESELEFGNLLNVELISLLFSPFVFAFLKAVPIFGRFDTMQKQYAPEAHYYLNTISVAPSAQGQGFSSKLIRPFLEQATAEKRSVYTETMTPENVGLYEHFGFQIMEDYRVPKTDLHIWSFYRRYHPNN